MDGWSGENTVASALSQIARRGWRAEEFATGDKLGAGIVWTLSIHTDRYSHRGESNDRASLYASLLDTAETMDPPIASLPIRRGRTRLT